MAALPDSIDALLIPALNGWVGVSPVLDRAIVMLSQAELLKGVVTFAIFWWLWGAPADRHGDRRPTLLAGFAAAVAAVAAGKGLAAILPAEPRPLHDPALAIRLADGLPAYPRDGANAFPSDHAVLYVAMAVAILRASRVAGLLALLHALVVVCLPRVVLGLHGPSDVAAGALVGAGVVLALAPPFEALLVRTPLYDGLTARPGFLHAALFAATMVAALNFAPLREVARDLAALAPAAGP